MIGKDINGFHIVEKVGQGGMAEVYKAVDLKLERDVAIKFLRTSSEDYEVSRQRFELEAKALAKLRHPNIVSVLGYGEYEGRPYLVMEYVQGQSLKEMLGKPMPWQKAASLIVPIARALHYAHGKKIVHRDVKPSNILINQDGEPMLSDFGVAKMMDVKNKKDLTGTSVGIGTPHYMAPEQGRGQEVGPKSDIYSLGVVFYEMVTGRKPYEADTPFAVLLKHIEDPVPNPAKAARGLPQQIVRVILKAMSKNPKNRFEDMLEFATALEGQGPLKPTKPEKTKRQSFSLARPLIFGLIGFAVVAISIWIINNGIWPIAGSQTATSSGFLITRGMGTHLDIEFMNETGTGFFSLFDHPGKNQVATISPDGGKIAFVSDSGGDNDIYIFDISSGEIEKLVETSTTEWNPVWSPDGGQLAFVSDFSGSFDLYLINADGSGMRQMTKFPISEWHPSWSPDGKQIVFQYGDESYSESDLYILTVASGQITPLTNDQALDGRPSWSPDGSQIAFDSDINGNLDIYTISPNGNNRNQITTNPNNESSPAWSPDGLNLVFMMDMGSGNEDLFMIDVDGTDLTRLTNTPVIETEPIWILLPETVINDLAPILLAEEFAGITNTPAKSESPEIPASTEFPASTEVATNINAPVYSISGVIKSESGAPPTGYYITACPSRGGICTGTPTMAGGSFTVYVAIGEYYLGINLDGAENVPPIGWYSAGGMTQERNDENVIAIRDENVTGIEVIAP
jgi:serine/threonine protein kinase